MSIVVFCHHLNVNFLLLDRRMCIRSLGRSLNSLILTALTTFELDIVEALVVDLGRRLHLLACLGHRVVSRDVILFDAASLWAKIELIELVVT